MSISKIASKVIGEKKRWRAYKARVKKLPQPYLTATEAFERYLKSGSGRAFAFKHFRPTGQ